MAEIPKPKKTGADEATETPTPQEPVVETPTPVSEVPAADEAETTAAAKQAAFADILASKKSPTTASVETTYTYSPENVAKMSTESQPETVVVEVPDANKATKQAQQIKEQVIAILSDLPDYIGNFYQQYKRPLTALGLLLAVVVALKVFLGIVDALNDIPLLQPTFELVGIGYSVWFVYRYLLKSSNRQELLQSLQGLKEQILGRKA